MNNSKILGGILLVSGTAIGAGMLALPIHTAMSGFIPSAIAFVISWFFMTLAALLLLEVNLWLPGEKDLLSMISATMGKGAKAISWILYLLLLYSLIAAYLEGSSAWLIKLHLSQTKVTLSRVLSISIIILLFGGIASMGTAITEKCNRWLAFGLIIAYFILIASSLTSIVPAQLERREWTQTFSIFSLLITAFGFSVVLPSLTNYLDRNVRSLKKVIILGSIIPLVIYLFWELVSLGIIPLEGEIGFRKLAENDNGTGVALALEHIVGNHWISQSSQWFSIFAILTSLLGVSLALFHFLADALRLNPKKGFNRLTLFILTYLPPFCVVLFYPSGFGRILSFAGIIVAVLLGIIPAIMVWRGRYHQNIPHPGFRLFGGKVMIILIIFFFSCVAMLEVKNWIVFLI